MIAGPTAFAKDRRDGAESAIFLKFDGKTELMPGIYTLGRQGRQVSENDTAAHVAAFPARRGQGWSPAASMRCSPSLVTVYKSSDVTNFAQGEIFMLGGYVAMLRLLWSSCPIR